MAEGGIKKGSLFYYNIIFLICQVENDYERWRIGIRVGRPPHSLNILNTLNLIATPLFCYHTLSILDILTISLQIFYHVLFIATIFHYLLNQYTPMDHPLLTSLPLLVSFSAIYIIDVSSYSHLNHYY